LLKTNELQGIFPMQLCATCWCSSSNASQNDEV